MLIYSDIHSLTIIEAHNSRDNDGTREFFVAQNDIFCKAVIIK